MVTPVLICDDSSMARKQMARALPAEWDISLSFAADGHEALAAIQRGEAEVMFLDLTMPGMSGYEVLQEIRRQDLPCVVLVVSGDIQPKARQWVFEHGALEFLAKPISRDQVRQTLLRFGLMTESSIKDVPQHNDSNIFFADEPVFDEVIREVVNIAMGQAASKLSTLLDSFIALPVPTVFHCRYQQLPRLLACARHARLSAVSQGFCGRGISGEAILVMESTALTAVSKQIGRNAQKNGNSQDPQVSGTAAMFDTLIELCGLLAGSCLNGISEQLDLQFNHGYPAVLGHQQLLPRLLGIDNKPADTRTDVMVIEITYRLLGESACHLILAFTDDSMAALHKRVSLLIREESTSDVS